MIFSLAMPRFYHVNTEDVTHTPQPPIPRRGERQDEGRWGITHTPGPRSPGGEKDRTRGDGVSHTHTGPRSLGGEKDRTRGDRVLDAVGEALAPGDCDLMGRTGRGRQLAGVRLRSLQARGALRRVRRLSNQPLDAPRGRGCVCTKLRHPRRGLEGHAQRVYRGWSGLRGSPSIFVSFFFF